MRFVDIDFNEIPPGGAYVVITLSYKVQHFQNEN